MAAKRPTLTEDRVGELEADIEAMEGLAQRAEDDRDYGPAVSARSRLVSLRAELARTRSAIASESARDDLRRTRLLRSAAVADGSWVAAERLARRESELASARAAEVERRAASTRAAKDPGALTRRLVDLINDAPESVLAAIAEAVDARRGGKRPAG